MLLSIKYSLIDKNYSLRCKEVAAISILHILSMGRKIKIKD